MKNIYINYIMKLMEVVDMPGEDYEVGNTEIQKEFADKFQTVSLTEHLLGCDCPEDDPCKDCQFLKKVANVEKSLEKAGIDLTE